MSNGGTEAKKKRVEIRRELWPAGDCLVFDPSDKKTKGYAQVPRVVPLVACLINEIGGRENAGSLYQAVWAHDWGQGIVEVRSFKALLHQAGYSGKGSRAERTWRERIRILKKYGFIYTAAKGLDDIGYILLIDPHIAVLSLWRSLPEDADTKALSGWFEQFRLFCLDWGVDLKAFEKRASEFGPE